MSSKSHRQAWSIVDRLPGESHEHWNKRGAEAHRRQWRQDKIHRGEWLSAEEYARRTGRPGKTLSGVEEQFAALHREQAAQAAQAPQKQPAVAAPSSPAAPSPVEKMHAAAHAAAHDAVVGAGMAALHHVIREGKNADPLRVAKEATVAGAQSAARGVLVRGVGQAIEEGVRLVSPSLLQEATKQAVAASGKELLKQSAKSALRSNAIGAAAGLVVEQGVQTARLLSGQIDGAEYGRRSFENVASSGGSLGGTTLGAAIGTAICPGVGTVIGAAVVGFAGSVGGSKLARWMVG